jgi:hypothetical protein
MHSKDDLCETNCKDLADSNHITSKLPADSLDYRPTEKQRSTLDLLQYLSAVGIGFFEVMLANDMAAVRTRAAVAKEMAASDFPAAIDREIAELRAAFAGISQTTFETQTCTMPWGETFTIEQGVLNTLCKWIPAYKMQLFLYAKTCGATQIGTMNLWHGKDPAPKA